MLQMQHGYAKARSYWALQLWMMFYKKWEVTLDFQQREENGMIHFMFLKVPVGASLVVQRLGLRPPAQGVWV